MTRVSATLIAAAVTGILVGATGCGTSQPAPAASGATASPAAAIPKHACKGQNDCKGQGGCKTA